MKPNLLILTLALGCLVASTATYGQNPPVSGGLGLSDAQWKELFGAPTPFARDAWAYKGGRYYTRSWARKDTISRDGKYAADNHYVKYIEIVWGRNTPALLTQARAEMKERLPADAKLIAKFRRRGSKAFEYYSSRFLAERILPIMASAPDCITPWGYGTGKFKVEYHFIKRRISRVVIDIGEPHETTIEKCIEH